MTLPSWPQTLYCFCSQAKLVPILTTEATQLLFAIYNAESGLHYYKGVPRLCS